MADVAPARRGGRKRCEAESEKPRLSVRETLPVHSCTRRRRSSPRVFAMPVAVPALLAAPAPGRRATGAGGRGRVRKNAFDTPAPTPAPGRVNLAKQRRAGARPPRAAPEAVAPGGVGEDQDAAAAVAAAAAGVEPGFSLATPTILDARPNPLLVFVNGKSGGRRGAQLTAQLAAALNPLVIVDLATTEPCTAIARFLYVPVRARHFAPPKFQSSLHSLRFQIATET